ncbi:hypothetical protein MRX96_014368 [Rhipicephalus microplus]
MTTQLGEPAVSPDSSAFKSVAWVFGNTTTSVGVAKSFTWSGAAQTSSSAARVDRELASPVRQHGHLPVLSSTGGNAVDRYLGYRRLI